MLGVGQYSKLTTWMRVGIEPKIFKDIKGDKYVTNICNCISSCSCLTNIINRLNYLEGDHTICQTSKLVRVEIFAKDSQTHEHMLVYHTFQKNHILLYMFVESFTTFKISKPSLSMWIIDVVSMCIHF